MLARVCFKIQESNNPGRGQYSYRVVHFHRLEETKHLKGRGEERKSFAYLSFPPSVFPEFSVLTSLRKRSLSQGIKNQTSGNQSTRDTFSSLMDTLKSPLSFSHSNPVHGLCLVTLFESTYKPRLLLFLRASHSQQA